jgi:hypothetical protein
MTFLFLRFQLLPHNTTTFINFGMCNYDVPPLVSKEPKMKNIKKPPYQSKQIDLDSVIK